MPRAKRGFKRRRRHNKILELAKGYRFGLKNKIRRAAEAVDRAHRYAFEHRRAKKGDFRQLWIARMAAACQANDISYSRFIAALNKAKIGLNRKMLAEIALVDANAFSQIVNQVRAHAPQN